MNKFYAVVEDFGDSSVCCVCLTRADAEEWIITECEQWTYEVLMNEDPHDVFGNEEWDYKEDYWELMHDCIRCFKIEEVLCFV